MIGGIIAIVILDMKRFWLEKTRMIAGLIQPLLYLFVLGAGLGGSSTMGDRYRPYIFPGTMALSLLFSATFAAIVIVFDRQVGFFKAILVAPVPRPAIALGKILSGALQAFCQGFILLPFAHFAGVPLTIASTLLMILTMMLSAIVFSALGVAVAARFTSTTVFPIVSNAMLLPMYFLSGALYPLTAAPHWMQVLARFDPVAYAVDLMRGSLFGVFFFPVWMSLAATAAFILLFALSAVQVFNKGDDTHMGPANLPWRR